MLRTTATLSDVLLQDDAFSPRDLLHTYHQFLGFFIISNIGSFLVDVMSDKILIQMSLILKVTNSRKFSFLKLQSNRERSIREVCGCVHNSLLWFWFVTLVTHSRITEFKLFDHLKVVTIQRFCYVTILAFIFTWGR
jgi:hypothetical protein